MADVPLKLVGEFDDRRIVAGLDGLKGKLSNLEKSFKAAFAITGVVLATRQIIKLGEGVAGLQDQLQVLESLAGSAGKSIVNALIDSADGALSFRDAVQLTNTALGKLPFLAEDISGLGTLGRRLAQIWGTDTAGAIESVVKQIASGRWRELDQIAGALGISFGTFNEIQKELADSLGVSVDKITDLQVKQEAYNRILKGTADMAAPGSNPFERLRIALTDFFDAIAFKLLGGEAGKGFETLADSIKRLTERLLEIPQEKIDEFLDSLKKIAAGVATFELLRRSMDFMRLTVLSLSAINLPGMLAGWGRAFVWLQVILANVYLRMIWIAEGMADVGSRITAANVAVNLSMTTFKGWLLVIGRLTPAIILLVAAIKSWREITDSLWNSLKNLGVALAGILDWLWKLLRGLAQPILDWFGKLINVSITLSDLWKVMAGIMAVVETGLITVTSAIEGVTGAIRDLVTWLNTGTLSWSNFNTAFDRWLNRTLPAINRIRRAFGLDPISSGYGPVPGAGVIIAPSTPTVLPSPRTPAPTITAVPPGGGAGGGAGTSIIEEVNEQLEAFGRIMSDYNTRLKNLIYSERAGLITQEEFAAEKINLDKNLIDSLINLNNTLGLTDEQHQLLNVIIDNYIKSLGSLAKSTEQVEDNMKAFFQAIDDSRAEFERITEGYLEAIGILSPEKQALRGRLQTWFEGLDPEIQRALRASTDIMSAMGFEKQESVIAEGVEKIEKVLSDFVQNFANVLSRFLEDWGWSGGKKTTQDWLGLGRQLLSQPTQKWGVDIAKRFGWAVGLGGPIGALLSGAAGWTLNRLFGDKPIEIEQPLDIRIVDIETRLLNFFNFRGMSSFTYSPGFKEVFENGII